MEDLLNIKIISSDGKKFEDKVEAIYLNIKDYGLTGFLYNHIETVGVIDVSIFYIVKNGKKEFFSTSGGIIDCKKDTLIVLTDTFEKEDEIDLKRAKEEKEKALKNIDTFKKESNDIELKRAEFSLKKALNRLSLKGE